MTTPEKKRRRQPLINVVIGDNHDLVQWLDDKVYHGIRNRTMDPKMDRSKLMWAIIRARKAEEDARAAATSDAPAAAAAEEDPAVRKK